MQFNLSRRYVARASSPQYRRVILPHISRSNKLTDELTISGQQHELLDWLKETTFPMEARFADVDFARRAYSLIVKRIINSGVHETFASTPSYQAFLILMP